MQKRSGMPRALKKLISRCKGRMPFSVKSHITFCTFIVLFFVPLQKQTLKSLNCPLLKHVRCFQKALSTLFKNGTFSKRKKKISTSSLVHKGCLVFVTTVGIYTNRRRHMTVVCHFDRNQFRLFTEKISAFFCRKGTFAPILIRIANSCNAVS